MGQRRKAAPKGDLIAPMSHNGKEYLFYRLSGGDPPDQVKVFVRSRMSEWRVAFRNLPAELQNAFISFTSLTKEEFFAQNAECHQT